MDWLGVDSNSFIEWLGDCGQELKDKKQLWANGEALCLLNEFIELLVAKMVTEQGQAMMDKHADPLYREAVDG